MAYLAQDTGSVLSDGDAAVRVHLTENNNSLARTQDILHRRVIGVPTHGVLITTDQIGTEMGTAYGPSTGQQWPRGVKTA